MIDVCVIGGGVSGLAAATFLEEAGRTVQVWEAAPQAGGHVRSDTDGGRILDRAANGWLDNEPAMTRLLDLLELTPRLVSPNDQYGTRWILADGRMQAAPLSPGTFLQTDLITTAAKLRVALEPFMPRGASGQRDDPTADESVGAFVRRRLGPQFVDRMVGPMVAGIYASDPDELSLRGSLKRMFELEQEHRSLIVAMARTRRGGAPPGKLQTLPGGAGELSITMAQRLGARLRCDRRVTSVTRTPDGWRVEATDTAGETVRIDARQIVLACPGPAQARLVASIDPPASAALKSIPYGPVVVVCTAWSKGSWSIEPEGFGVLLARHEAKRQEGIHGVLGTLFTSSIFPEQAQGDEVLLRTILGGAIAPEIFDESDQELIARCRRAAVVCLGPERKPPHMVRVFRHPEGIPQYRVGHPARVATIRAAERRHPGLYFIGNHLEGIGVKDCARAGLDVTAKVLASQPTPSAPEGSP